jgi:VWFA-related protein
MNARLATLTVLLTVIGGYGASQLSPPGAAQELGSYRLAVDVDLVVLHASVRDRKGRFVADLGQGDFEVYEDGLRQSIQLFQYEDTPVTVGIVVDHSRSMRPKLAQVITAAQAFVHSSNPLDQMFIVNFTERVLLGLPAAIPFTNNATELEDAISNAPAAGMTALYDGVVKGIGQLQAGSHAKKVLLVISDGATMRARAAWPMS